MWGKMATFAGTNSKGMKRIARLMGEIASPTNIIYADMKARRGKTKSRRFISAHDERIAQEDLKLSRLLSTGTYGTSPYDRYRIYEPKEREICRLPYFPDRIAHHAIMRQLKGYWTALFIKNTYSCIEKRGIHQCRKDLDKALRRFPEKTTYCLKIDIRKFYPTMDHQVLKDIVKWKIKDPRLLTVLNEIIDSISTPVDSLPVELLQRYGKREWDSLEKGVPIGNYLSQFFANLYLTPFDIWCKQELKCRFYFRYADDIVILSDSKEWLRSRLLAIKLYLWHRLRLVLKPNYQVFPVDSRGIDFVGYVSYHDHTRLRKSIKERARRKLRASFAKSYPSYKGWFKHADCKHLVDKFIQEDFRRCRGW